MDHQRGDLQATGQGVAEAPFGLHFSSLDAAQCADLMLTQRRSVDDGAALFATPNIQHVAAMRTNAEFADAMRGADLIVADGFPVYRYVRSRGVVLPGRVTGREVIDRMMDEPDRLAGHRLFFVLDGDETAHAAADWAATHAPGAAIETLVPPFGFDTDPAQAAGLATRIADFGTTLLFMGIGAPKSELFVHRHRALLPPCWALCVGQSFRIALGLTVPPPTLMVRLNLEWAWRILLEPRRMLARYGPSGVGFLRAVAADRRGARRSLRRRVTRS